MATTELQAVVRFRFHDGDVIERFRDSDALIQHGENLAHLMDRITATGSVSGELLGDPSAELRGRFAGDGPVQLFTPWSRM